MMNSDREKLKSKGRYDFADLIDIMKTLLAPDGCPWDREQTHESLKRNLIEEAYETLEAIDKKDSSLLCEELGDVLLQIVFHAQLASAFTIDDVIQGICEKLITRHPHIFGTVSADTPAEVLANWESIKRTEKGVAAYGDALKRVPANLPALMRAYKVQQKARDAGFDWDAVGPVLDKVEEELGELRRAIAAASDITDVSARADAGMNDNASIEAEYGDLLFAAVNASRFLRVHPELALTASTDKFIRRFEAMEKLIAADGLSMPDMTLPEMDAYWDKVKKQFTGRRDEIPDNV